MSHSLICSFCSKHKDELGDGTKIVVGENASICAPCIRLCAACGDVTLPVLTTDQRVVLIALLHEESS